MRNSREVLALLLGWVLVTFAQEPTLNVDWKIFLDRSDLVYVWNHTSPSQPNLWTNSLFGGNGNLGFMIWFPSQEWVRIDVSRVDVYDDRTPDLKEYLDNFVYDQPRLPIGHFQCHLPGEFLVAAGRTTLYNGISTITINTTAGVVGLEVFASAAYNLADVISISNLESLACNMSFVPEQADSTWKGNDPSYVSNPPPNITTTSMYEIVMQPHLKGSAHTTAIFSFFSNQKQTVFTTISAVMATPVNANDWVTHELDKCRALGYIGLRDAHKARWKDFWTLGGGFITMADSAFESFWYVQMYKFGSAVRVGGIVHDLEGPWFVDNTPWPDLHWDMNLQQTYVFPMTANRLGLSATLADFVESLHRSKAFTGNVPLGWQQDSDAAPTGASSLGGQETCYWNYGAGCKTAPPSITGNLLWTLQVVALHGRYSGNVTVMTDVVFPILVRALNFYQHFQFMNSTDGKIHLPLTFSPEYPGPPGPDANYDLSLYRWGLLTVGKLAQEYNLTDPNLPKFRETLATLQLYSIDSKSGTYEIYAGRPYLTPHRHYSHLFMIWPLHLTDVTQEPWKGLAQRSVDLWLATPELDSMFYRPVASKMNVLLDRKVAAYTNLSILLQTRVTSNTMYNEGPQGSCTETPYAAAWAIGELLVQSWNNSIDFFPGVEDVIVKASPDASSLLGLSTAAFYELRTEGAFLVSARRRIVVDNTTYHITATDFIAITFSEATSRTCVIRTTMVRPLVAVAAASIQEIGNNYVRVSTQTPEATVVLYSADYVPVDFVINMDPGTPTDFNFWGFPSKQKH